MANLTPEESKRYALVEAEWAEKIVSLKLDEQKLPSAVKWLYKKMGYEQLPAIHIVDSPLQALILDENLRRKLDGKSPVTELSSEYSIPEFLRYANVSDYGWIAYYDFKMREGEDVDEGFKEYFKEYVPAGIYDAIAYDTDIIVIRKPKQVFLNEANQLHRLDGPAIEFLDGAGFYAINNRIIKAKLARRVLNGEFTREEFLSLQNDEDRAAVIMYKGDTLLPFLKAEKVDEITIQHMVATPKGVDASGELVVEKIPETETIALYKTKGKDNKLLNEKFAWLVRNCPSTGTTYITPSNPMHDTALDAAKAHRPSWVPTEVPYEWFSRS